jgi:hypothetical protein
MSTHDVIIEALQLIGNEVGFEVIGIVPKFTSWKLITPFGEKYIENLESELCIKCRYNKPRIEMNEMHMYTFGKFICESCIQINNKETLDTIKNTSEIIVFNEDR